MGDKKKPESEDGGLFTTKNILPVAVGVLAFMLMQKYGDTITTKIGGMLPPGK